MVNSAPEPANPAERGLPGNADVAQRRAAVGGSRQNDSVMTDVARLCGVSKMTVSRVLNGHPRVSPPTRARVLAAMAELNYRPNTAARALVTGRSRVLGVISFNSALYGPASTLAGIEEAAREAGYFVSIATLKSGSPWTAKAVAEHVRAQTVDGIIISAPHAWAAEALRYLPGDLPVVALDAQRGAVPRVAVDQYAGAVKATEHLLSLGHATAWHLAGPADWASAQAREQGWRDTLSAAGRTVPPVVRGDWSVGSGYECGRSLARSPGLTAIFAANDQMALGVLGALREAGLDVPGHVSLVGFDDVPEARYFRPPLTSVRQDFETVGRRSLELLLEQLEGASRHLRHIVIEPTLVVRESTGAPARL
jgi:DNA-binding LacI/PurR family transcriptional regulator